MPLFLGMGDDLDEHASRAAGRIISGLARLRIQDFHHHAHH